MTCQPENDGKSVTDSGKQEEISVSAISGITNNTVMMEHYNELVEYALSLNHAINNPLTAIIGNADLILLTEKNNLSEGVRMKLETIISEAGRISKTIEKLGAMKKTILHAKSSDSK